MSSYGEPDNDALEALEQEYAANPIGVIQGIAEQVVNNSMVSAYDLGRQTNHQQIEAIGRQNNAIVIASLRAKYGDAWDYLDPIIGKRLAADPGYLSDTMDPQVIADRVDALCADAIRDGDIPDSGDATSQKEWTRIKDAGAISYQDLRDPGR